MSETHRSLETSLILSITDRCTLVILLLTSSKRNAQAQRLQDFNGVLIFDDKGTPLDSSDDEYLLVNKFVDRTGKEIAAKLYYDLALDPSGSLWIATDKGPISISSPSTFLSQTTPLATRPVGGKEPNLYYVLDNMPITAIAIDALGNKWCGTSTDGLYLLSSDGTELLAHYTKDNSPLLTNDVLSLAINHDLGELYIATSAGLVSLYIGRSSDWSTQSKEVYIYPNPLRPEDPDQITLSKLPAGTTVRSVDALLIHRHRHCYDALMRSKACAGYLVSIIISTAKVQHFCKLTINPRPCNTALSQHKTLIAESVQTYAREITS